MWSAKDESAAGLGMGTPFKLMRCGPSGGLRVAGLTHSDMRPLRQYSHSPQNTDTQVMTWSPGFT